MSGKEVTKSLFGEPPQEAGGSESDARERAAGHAQTVHGHIIRVAMESAADTEFDYLVPEELWPIVVGQRVEAPFGRRNKIETGFCVLADVPRERSFAGGKNGGKLKSIVRKVDEEPLLGPQLMELAFWISEYYVCPLGQVLTAMVPGAVKRAAGIRKQRCVYLGEGWQERLDSIKGAKQKKIVEILRQRGAVGADSALDAADLLEAAECGSAVLKKLADEQVVRVVQKRVFGELPAMPEMLAGQTAQGDAAIVLNDDQKAALEHVSRQIQGGRFGVTLLHGVTDSGKTEVYIRAIEEVVR